MSKQTRPTPKKRKATRSRSEQQQYDFLKDLEEVQRGMNPDFISSKEKRKRRMSRAILISAVMSPILALTSVVGIAYAINGIDVRAVGTQEVRATEVGRIQAQESLQAWIEAGDATFKGSTIVSWDGITGRQNVAATDNDPAFQLLTHQFTIQTKSGVYYGVSVPVAYSSSRGTKVLGTPSLTPTAPTATTGWEPKIPTGQWKAAGLSQPATDAVNGWASALLGQPQQLKLATRDGTAAHVYSTIAGSELVSATVVSSYAKANSQNQLDSSTIVATVDIAVRPAGAPDEQRETTTIRYDVLIRGADTAAPYVTAWGAYGSGFTLSDYENATSLTGDVDDPTQTTAPEAGDPSDDPSATEDPAAEQPAAEQPAAEAPADPAAPAEQPADPAAPAEQPAG